MRTRSRYAWLLAVLPAVALAGNDGTHFQVSAQVLAHVSLTPLGAPDQITVTAKDVSKGFLDVAATYRVSSNDPRGYVLRFDALTGLADRIEVRGLGQPLTVGDLGVESLQSSTAPTQDYSLRIRIYLPAATAQGQYPLPLQVSATTL